MYASMYVNICGNIDAYKYINKNIYMYVCACIYASTVCVYECMFECIYACVYVCWFVCMFMMTA